LLPINAHEQSVLSADIVAVAVEDQHGIGEVATGAAAVEAARGVLEPERDGFSLSLIPGVTAEATISSRLRKLFRPLESQGLIRSVWPTFSIRTARLDCQLWSITPSR